MSVDGALVKITEQSGSLLFFYFLPAIPTKNKDGSLVTKCVVELRMSKKILTKIISDVAENISMFEMDKKSQTPVKKEITTDMFA
jgi:hypothetical protein